MYDIDHALTIAQANVASVPLHANAALIELLFIAGTQVLAPAAHAALNRAIQHLQVVTSAPDSLLVELEAAKCL